MITNYHATWTGNGYPSPKRFARKQDCPLNNPGDTTLRIAFRFEVAWIVRDLNGAVLMPDGHWMSTFDFRLNQFGRVIGPQDMTCADHSPMAEAWRNACVDKRLSSLNR